jgi:hypothetical protein
MVLVEQYLHETMGPARALKPRAGPERRRMIQCIAVAMGATDKAGARLGYLDLRRPEDLAGPPLGCLRRLSAACEAMPAFIAARPSPDDVMPAAA